LNKGWNMKAKKKKIWQTDYLFPAESAKALVVAFNCKNAPLGDNVFLDVITDVFMHAARGERQTEIFNIFVPYAQMVIQRCRNLGYKVSVGKPDYDNKKYYPIRIKW